MRKRKGWEKVGGGGVAEVVGVYKKGRRALYRFRLVVIRST